jgi:prepilin-type N-terminal cleavage/methylation domain-containing protein
MASAARDHAQGFTLIEVLIGISLLVVVAIGVAQLAGMSTRALRASRDHTSAVILAAAKMDQLRALAWTYEPEAPGELLVPRTDLTTNLDSPDCPDDGPGLAVSPAGTLSASTPRYVDYLDGGGRWVGNGIDPPRSAVFVRRWAVQALPSDPERTRILSVLVTTVSQDRSRTAPWSRRTGVEAHLVSARTRRAQ